MKNKRYTPIPMENPMSKVPQKIKKNSKTISCPQTDGTLKTQSNPKAKIMIPIKRKKIGPTYDFIIKVKMY